MASNEDRLRRRRERDRLRRQAESATEREARSAIWHLYLCGVKIVKSVIDWPGVENMIGVDVLL